MKIRQVGAELFHADRWTDMMNLLFAFHNFVNACKKHIKSLYYHKEMQLQITYRLFTTLSQHKVCDFSGETFKGFKVL